MNSTSLSWRWHRLRAMGPGEVARHVRKRLLQVADSRRGRDWAAVPLQSSGLFPQLPDRGAAPGVLRDALKGDAQDILRGKWRAFGHLDLKVDDPPQWHADYLVGKNLATQESAFRLNHRDLPAGADIRCIWELSRWHPLVRLAMAAYILDEEAAGRKCVRWLEDWVVHNRPYRGWNWTSALEAGMRLIQFTWIDALLAGQAERWGIGSELNTLRHQILPAHARFTWRYQSFGSSANNHLLGELAGLILATVRWPALAQWGAALETLQSRWEHEVLAQFAEDGGNREQALNYHLFSWEFSWQTRMALLAAGRKPAPEVEGRLADAARFFWEVQATRDIWDYGDSDSAFVTPFFCDAKKAVPEWRGWMEESGSGGALRYWLDAPPRFAPPLGRGRPPATVPADEWWIYPKSGIALCECGFWWLRWDLSPLGYLRTAAHGHLDALHLSIWFKRVALVIDPGTGAYYADEALRTWLASRRAHNGPCPPELDFPRRLGPFLWSENAAAPSWSVDRNGLLGQLTLPQGRLHRRVEQIKSNGAWQIEDGFETSAGTGGEFSVHWQFAPDSWLKALGERKFAVNRENVSLSIEVDEKWSTVELVEQPHPPSEGRHAAETSRRGMVSPAFRKTCWAPYLKLTACSGEKPCLFRTTFLASDAS